MASAAELMSLGRLLRDREAASAALPSREGVSDLIAMAVTPEEVAAGMPRFSPAPKDVYAPIRLPVDRDLTLEDIPPGFQIMDYGVVDPSGNLARVRNPTMGEVVSHIANSMQPGGLVGMAAKGVAGAAHTGDAILGSGPVLRKAAKVGAPYPQYAESYPAPGPPIPMVDPKTGKEYDAKLLTPEAEAFKKTRAAIVKEMAKGYEPYFDPAQRTHVDPSNYPANYDTKTITPKKQATIDKDMEKIGSEDVRARVRAAYARGKELPNTGDWYAVGQLEKEFIKELGEVEGRKAFADRFATAMAATTGGADPESNLLMAAYGNYLRSKGEATPVTHQMPFPIGGQYAGKNIDQYEKIFGRGGWSSLGLEGANPKRHNFAQNFMGNQGAATIDEQITSGMTPGLQMPPPGKYGLYEQVLAEEAAKAGVSPQEFQAVAWSGFKNQKAPNYTRGKPMIEEVNDAIERTHRLTGMPREEIVRRAFVRGEIPLYSAAPVPTEEQLQRARGE